MTQEYIKNCRNATVLVLNRTNIIHFWLIKTPGSCQCGINIPPFLSGNWIKIFRIHSKNLSVARAFGHRSWGPSKNEIKANDSISIPIKFYKAFRRHDWPFFPICPVIIQQRQWWLVTPESNILSTPSPEKRLFSPHSTVFHPRLKSSVPPHLRITAHPPSPLPHKKKSTCNVLSRHWWLTFSFFF